MADELKNSRRDEEKTVSSIGLINALLRVAKDKQLRKKLSPLPRFNRKEVEFIFELVYYKQYKDIPIAVAEFLTDNFAGGMALTNATTIRRIKFIKYLFTYGKGAHAAVAAGYSSIGAKQQASRLIKWFQKRLDFPKDRISTQILFDKFYEPFFPTSTHKKG